MLNFIFIILFRGSFDITVTKEGSLGRDPFTESIQTMTEYRGLLEDMPGATRFWDGMMGAYEKAMCMCIRKCSYSKVYLLPLHSSLGSNTKYVVTNYYITK